MPSWVKKRFQLLKRDLLSHLVDEKNRHNTLDIAVNCNRNNEKITTSIKSPIQKIRNDLRVNRIRIKTDMNAYRDYAQWRDQVLINQNNCALRCIREEKINNIDKVDSFCNGTNTIQTHNDSAYEHRSNYCNDKATSSNTIDDTNCDSESEFLI